MFTTYTELKHGTTAGVPHCYPFSIWYNIGIWYLVFLREHMQAYVRVF